MSVFKQNGKEKKTQMLTMKIFFVVSSPQTYITQVYLKSKYRYGTSQNSPSQNQPRLSDNCSDFMKHITFALVPVLHHTTFLLA